MLNHMATYIAELYQEVTGTVDNETTAEKHDTPTPTSSSNTASGL